MFHKNRFLHVDCSESGKSCVCAATLLGGAPQVPLGTPVTGACLPPGGLVEVGKRSRREGELFLA